MPTDSIQQYDIAIIGGGLVGLGLALALKDSNKSIIILEAKGSAPYQASFDSRSIALSYTSKKILENLQCWQALKPHAQVINGIHVSSRGQFAKTRLAVSDVADASVEALGYVVPIEKMAQNILTKLNNDNPCCEYIAPATVQQCDHQSDNSTIIHYQVQTALKKCQAKLIIATDGAHSSTRQLINAQVSQKDYQQVATVANIGLARDHGGQAFERFTKDGPIALLPMLEQRANLVWVLPPEQAAALNKTDDDSFLHSLQTAFGYRMGRFDKVGRRVSYPLSLITMEKPYQQGVLFLGNALHNLHPVSGQGFNLCLREIALLAQHIYQQNSLVSAVDHFLEHSKQDRDNTIKFTDNLVSVFSHDLLPIKLARSMGLLAIDNHHLAKRIFVKQAMGYRPQQANLACDLPFTQ